MQTIGHYALKRLCWTDPAACKQNLTCASYISFPQAYNRRVWNIPDFCHQLVIMSAVLVTLSPTQKEAECLCLHSLLPFAVNTCRKTFGSCILDCHLTFQAECMGRQLALAHWCMLPFSCRLAVGKVQIELQSHQDKLGTLISAGTFAGRLMQAEGADWRKACTGRGV